MHAYRPPRSKSNWSGNVSGGPRDRKSSTQLGDRHTLLNLMDGIEKDWHCRLRRKPLPHQFLDRGALLAWLSKIESLQYCFQTSYFKPCEKTTRGRTWTLCSMREFMRHPPRIKSDPLMILSLLWTQVSVDQVFGAVWTVKKIQPILMENQLWENVAQKVTKRVLEREVPRCIKGRNINSILTERL